MVGNGLMEYCWVFASGIKLSGVIVWEETFCAVPAPCFSESSWKPNGINLRWVILKDGEWGEDQKLLFLFILVPVAEDWLQYLPAF